MEDTRPVIIGIAPAEGQPPFGPGTRSGQMLMQLVGVPSYAELRRRFKLINLSQEPIVFPRSSRSKKRLATYRAHLNDLANAFKVNPEASYILAGFEVRRAFGARMLPEEGRGALLPFQWWRSRIGPMVSILPHPSGLNRFYNSIENRRLARRFLQEAGGIDESV